MSSALGSSDVELSLRLLVDLDNSTDAELEQVRLVLAVYGFFGADLATGSDLTSAIGVAGTVSKTVRQILEVPSDAPAAVNELMTGLVLTPMMTDHDGLEPHLHWTPEGAAFADRLHADLVLAVAISVTLGTLTRVGRCSASDCGRLFYDHTKNRSTRYCTIGTCGTRTRQIRHRQRKAQRALLR